MSEQKIIAVAGATGSQGGGVVRALLADPQKRFAVRALTRDTGSASAEALRQLGADVVRADFEDEGSVVAALTGSYGAFLVTNFWAHGSARRELDETAVLARAAAAADVAHVVWSTLEDTRSLLPLDDPRMPVLQDHYNVPHFDAKGEGNALFADAGVPTTYLNTTFYFQNFIEALAPRRGDDGVLTLSLPFEEGRLLSGVDVADIGRTVFSIFAAGGEYIGKTLSLAGDHLTGAEYASQLGDALGEPVRFQSVPYDTFRGFGFPGAEEMGNMFQYYGDFDTEFTGARELEWLRRFVPGLNDFRTWAAENAQALKVA
ncbi:NmrA/HSCARG family protein [Arthrobacter zhaoguopingii]|uniref:NmrA/HSCARG family protein n=1 Tax=Arthrobacter zhaoguopingii TaxID=2681491 RepID=UPI00135A6016|nr:NmrA/HSCARG family protein [Arthrobacter zhaoguopingii]